MTTKELLVSLILMIISLTAMLLCIVFPWNAWYSIILTVIAIAPFIYMLLYAQYVIGKGRNLK